MKTIFFKLHRRLSLFLAIPVLLWSLTGILHPLMASWMSPEIPHSSLPPNPLKPDASLLSPASVFSDIPQLNQLHLIEINGAPAYLAITPHQQLIIRNSHSGKDIPNAEAQYAEQLARAYLDDTSSPLISVEKITRFDATYSYINRFLPAYRVSLDRHDGMQVVVDLISGKLASFDSPSKRVFSTLFSWFHTWSFLGSRDDMFRIIVVLLVSILTLAVGVSGIANLIFFRSRHKSGSQRKLPSHRKFHRRLGALSSLFYIMFSISGISHVAVKLVPDDSDQWQSRQSIPTSVLTSSPAQVLAKSELPVSSIGLADIHGVPYFRLAIVNRDNPGQSIYLNAHDLTILDHGEERFAICLATEFSGLPKDDVTNIELITQFRDDYGFIQKRLPVTRVHYPGEYYFHYTVDTANIHLAQRTSPASLAEALFFINFHKWHFLDPISKSLRDYASTIAVLSIATVTLLGISLLKKQVIS